MHILSIILAILLGMIGHGFGLAGVLGMIRFDRKEGMAFRITDSFLTGGILSLLTDIAANWKQKPRQRRFIYAAVVSLALCLFAVLCAQRLDN